MSSIEFFFDCSSPWTYLAFHNIQPLAREHGAEIAWKPILVGGVFNAVNPSVYEFRDNPVPRKARHLAKDLADWARLAGLRILWPPTVFPVNSVTAMRACLVAQDRDALVPFAGAVFAAYWSDDRDISSPGVLADICSGVGLDGRDVLKAAATQPCKDRLRANTDELIARGGYGSPTMFLNGDDMYFGNDRLPLLRAALGAAMA